MRRAPFRRDIILKKSGLRQTGLLLLCKPCCADYIIPHRLSVLFRNSHLEHLRAVGSLSLDNISACLSAGDVYNVGVAAVDERTVGSIEVNACYAFTLDADIVVAAYKFDVVDKVAAAVASVKNTALPSTFPATL